MAGGVTGVLVILGVVTAWAVITNFLSFHQGHLYYRLLHHWGRGEGPQNQDQEPGQVSVKTSGCQIELWKGCLPLDRVRYEMRKGCWGVLGEESWFLSHLLLLFTSCPYFCHLPLPASSSVRLWLSTASSWQLSLATWLR